MSEIIGRNYENQGNLLPQPPTGTPELLPTPTPDTIRRPSIESSDIQYVQHSPDESTPTLIQAPIINSVDQARDFLSGSFLNTPEERSGRPKKFIGPSRLLDRHPQPDLFPREPGVLDHLKKGNWLKRGWNSLFWAYTAPFIGRQKHTFKKYEHDLNRYKGYIADDFLTAIERQLPERNRPISDIVLPRNDDPRLRYTSDKVAMAIMSATPLDGIFDIVHTVRNSKGHLGKMFMGILTLIIDIQPLPTPFFNAHYIGRYVDARENSYFRGVSYLLRDRLDSANEPKRRRAKKKFMTEQKELATKVVEKVLRAQARVDSSKPPAPDLPFIPGKAMEPSAVSRFIAKRTPIGWLARKRYKRQQAQLAKIAPEEAGKPTQTTLQRLDSGISYIGNAILARAAELDHINIITASGQVVPGADQRKAVLQSEIQYLEHRFSQLRPLREMVNQAFYTVFPPVVRQ